MILLIEDDLTIAAGITYSLELENFQVQHFSNVSDSMNYINQDSFDITLAILDLTLPDGSGYDICKAIKNKSSDIPIIFLSACDEEVNVVMGLDMGADDYIPKPFGMMELIARVKALLRRSQVKNEETEYRIGNLYVCPSKHIVTVDGKNVVLTLKEFEILCMLLKSEDIVLTRDTLLNEIWGYSFDGENRTVDVHIRTLRQKLGSAGEYIETIRGIGYKIGGYVR